MRHLFFVPITSLVLFCLEAAAWPMRIHLPLLAQVVFVEQKSLGIVMIMASVLLSWVVVILLQKLYCWPLLQVFNKLCSYVIYNRWLFIM